MAAVPQTDLHVTLRLSQIAQAKLAERASASGQDLSQYVSTLVESVVESPRTLEEISGAVYQRFLESGTSDDALSEELERAKHEMRSKSNQSEIAKSLSTLDRSTDDIKAGRTRPAKAALRQIAQELKLKLDL